MPNVLITGCSSGIGRALADAFKAAGFEVWASARQPDDVAALQRGHGRHRRAEIPQGHALYHSQAQR